MEFELFELLKSLIRTVLVFYFNKNFNQNDKLLVFCSQAYTCDSEKWATF